MFHWTQKGFGGSSSNTPQILILRKARLFLRNLSIITINFLRHPEIIILKNWHQKVTVKYNRAITTHHFNVENSNCSETIVMQVEGSNSLSMVFNYCTEIGCYSRVQGLLHKTKILIKEFKQSFTILNLLFQIME